LPGRIEL
jgi:hypothetical protein